jgi:hypothetical protein
MLGARDERTHPMRFGTLAQSLGTLLYFACWFVASWLVIGAITP